MRIRSKNTTPDRPDAVIIREAHYLDYPSGHQEFSHISPALITSSATKRGGVIKYIDNKCVCAVKYHNIRPADLLGEVINDANRVNLTIGRPDFGNYEAGAN